MGSDMGHEFSHGNVLSDVLLRSAGKTDFQSNVQKKKSRIVKLEQVSPVGTCLYQEECKILLINCGAVIRL